MNSLIFLNTIVFFLELSYVFKTTVFENNRENASLIVREIIECYMEFDYKNIQNLGGEQNLELLSVERPIFQNYKITNIKIAKDELFDYFIYEFIF